MPNHLVGCPSCGRHLRVHERSCPFCGAACPPDLASTPARPEPTERLGRAALVSFGAVASVASALTLGACGSSATPLYGAPAPSDAGRSDGAREDVGGGAPAYGLPAPPPDAGEPDSGPSGALYGAPPP